MKSFDRVALRDHARAGLRKNDRSIDRTLQLMDDAGFREYYDPRNGTGYGPSNSTVAAAVCLDWLESGA
jgi:hypothetical protein